MLGRACDSVVKAIDSGPRGCMLESRKRLYVYDKMQKQLKPVVQRHFNHDYIKIQGFSPFVRFRVALHINYIPLGNLALVQ